MNKRYDTKVPSIIKRTIIKEEVVFRGKKIIRERVVKEFKIPKIINHDIGFQLMFGMTSSPIINMSKKGGIEEYSFEFQQEI